MMKCPKCRGLMNPEEFVSISNEGPSWEYEGWHCIYCGQVVDSLILENRTKEMGREKEEAGSGSGKGRKRILSHC